MSVESLPRPTCRGLAEGLVLLLSLGPALGTWEKLGAVVDPNCQPSDHGAVVDPGGRPAPRIVVGNYGAVVDPNGQPAANPNSQNLGAVLDPDGQPSH